MKRDQRLEKCFFYGRPIEPLAFYLPPSSDVQQQWQCPLYGKLPKEARDMVWEYVLTDSRVLFPYGEEVYRRRRASKAGFAKVGNACALLQTCKAVYLETYCLPMLLNGTYFIAVVPGLYAHQPELYAICTELYLNFQATYGIVSAAPRVLISNALRQ